MSVLVYTESWDGSFRKSTFEAVSFANETAKLLNTDVVAIAFGNENNDELNKLSKFGADKILAAGEIKKCDSKSASDLIANHHSDANIIIFASTYTSKMIAPRLSAKLKAGIISNVISLPSNTSPITIKRKSFSGKAIENTTVSSKKTIIIILYILFRRCSGHVRDVFRACSGRVQDAFGMRSKRVSPMLSHLTEKISFGWGAPGRPAGVSPKNCEKLCQKRRK